MSQEARVIHVRKKELLQLDQNHFIHPTSAPKEVAENGPSLIFSSGKGIYVNDLSGKKYIDGMSMLWNVNLGHGQRELAEVAKEQMLKLAYSSSFKGFSNEPVIQLAAKLVEMAPGDLNAVFFTSGGSESNDTAFKFSRFYWEQKGEPKKRKIIGMRNGYHGVTMAAQSATGLPTTNEFANSSVEGFYHATPHLTNCERGDKSDPNYKQSIRSLIELEGADTIAAIIIEPVQGAGGVHIPPNDYLQAVRDLCDEFNILMIADEVICGFGRTGKMFGVDNWNVIPDLMCIAKGITSGYAQLGGVMMNDDIRDVMINYEGVLAHGFTYSGHPTACAVALKNIEMIERDGILANVKEIEKVLKKGLAYLEDKHPIVRNSRAIGLLSAFELFNPYTGELFNQSLQGASIVVDECFNRQLILRHIGNHIVAIAPPLIINEQEINRIIEIVDESITAFRKNI